MLVVVFAGHRIIIRDYLVISMLCLHQTINGDVCDRRYHCQVVVKHINMNIRDRLYARSVLNIMKPLGQNILLAICANIFF